ncbi:MAG TPA: YueI family protein [Bacillaceae bacterium]
MKSSNVDEYLQKGIYGPKEIKPDERKKYLGTLRERIVAVLTKSQVMEPGVYPEIIQLMKEHPKAQLLLNGELDYAHLTDYIHAARSNQLSFSIVSNKENRTDIGLVLAYDHAIDKEDIHIQGKKEEKPETKKKKNGFISFFKRILPKQ